MPQNPFNAEIPCAPWAVWTRDQGSINAHSGIILTLPRMPSLFFGRGNFSGFDECFKHLFDAPKTRQLSPGSILFFPPTAQISLLSDTFSTKPRKEKETRRKHVWAERVLRKDTVDSKGRGFWMCGESVEQIEKSFNHWVGAHKIPIDLLKPCEGCSEGYPFSETKKTLLDHPWLTAQEHMQPACINNWSLSLWKSEPSFHIISSHILQQCHPSEIHWITLWILWATEVGVFLGLSAEISGPGTMFTSH